MSDQLSDAINKVRQTAFIKSNWYLDNSLSSIQRYSTSDEQIAYLMGHLFLDKKNNYFSSREVEEIILHAVKNENLQDYFYGKAKPEFVNYKYMAIVFIIIGIIAILSGLYQILNGYFNFGFSRRYMTPVADMGGIPIILGLVCFIGGLVRFRYEMGNEKFRKSIVARDL